MIACAGEDQQRREDRRQSKAEGHGGSLHPPAGAGSRRHRVATKPTRGYPPRVRSLSLAFLTLSLLAPPAAHAQEGGWAEIFDPAQRLGRRRMRQGLAKLVHGLSPGDPALGAAPRWVLLEQALVRFERARRVLPDDPELAYYTAYALTRWERPARDGGTEYRADEAIVEWQRVRALDPEFFPDRVAYELAMLHMRRQEFERARAEYEAALRTALPPTVQLEDRFYLPATSERALAFLFSGLDRANVHGNLAEVTMLTGDLRSAITHYEAAIEQTEDPFTRSLAEWGLALTLDRSGDSDAALEVAARALRGDPVPPDDPRFAALHRAHGAMSVLHLDFVFFEPVYELHAYEALGHEATARMDGGVNRPALERALRSWRLFLAEGGTSSRFAGGARRHLERLEAELGVEAAPLRAPSGRGLLR